MSRVPIMAEICGELLQALVLTPATDSGDVNNNIANPDSRMRS